MSVLDQITQMRRENRGISDDEIASELKQQGIPARDIKDALDREKIRSAVSDVQGEDDVPVPSQNSGQDVYTPEQTQQGYGYDQNQVYAPQPQEYYPQQGFSQGGYEDYSAQQTGTDTIVEISGQVFDEKISDIAKKIDSMDEFRSLAQSRLENMNERLKRIESIIDRLQSAILEKVGSYGGALESIKKEMSMMQDSFTKTLAPMATLAERKSAEQKEKPKVKK
ncbi:MAG: hypothetical protein M1165_00335 [Candidatus Pacearchaeota archaeon]|nr:hypothetical protein [Candidatus Pacearchaeota archaeon]